MLFNSFPFLFVFLPTALSGLFYLAERKPSLAPAWLALASLIFYAGWSPAYLPLLLISIAFNYYVGLMIGRVVAVRNFTIASWWMWFGVSADVLALGYYKYAGFLSATIHNAIGLELGLENITLPVGISFFTFTQIAYLVDARRGLTREYEATRYGLFVSYFPHLIAGPILHHREMIEQFAKPNAFRFSNADMAAGLALFSIGLAKKVLLADSIAPVANAVFDTSIAGALTIAEAWVGTLAYSMQIYFDFSGYSDMALGLGMMMGVRLPLNFSSPYKAVSIIEFWRCWHMTLSRFLRDYLYIPLGGNRSGPTRRYLNILATMLIGGLWHGASWTFVVWGGLHGFYLMVNHAWRSIGPARNGRLAKCAGWFLTFVAVNVAWVFFRAESVGSAFDMLSLMFGLKGFAMPSWIAGPLKSFAGIALVSGSTFKNGLFDVVGTLSFLAVLVMVVLLLPNSQTIMADYRPSLDSVKCSAGRFAWSPTGWWALGVGALIAACVTKLGGDSPFLYFRF